MIEPYYQDEAVTIYHADAREVLPLLSGIDLVLTDPPYGVNVECGSFEDTPANVAALMADVVPLLRRYGAPVLITTGITSLFSYPRPDWVLNWFMPNAAGVGPWGFCTWQPIIAYGKDPYAGKGSRPDGVERLVAQSEQNGHPCPKPLAIMRWLVARGTTAPGQLVLDPFMGSGTTLRAAKDLGRKAIGIEIEERYCEIAAKRMAQGVLL